MSRRKHVIQELERGLPPLEDHHEVVKVVAPRGNSLVDVERADSTRTLCIMPKKFNRTLWIKRDGFLLIERDEGVPGPSSSRAQAGASSAQQANGQHQQAAEQQAQQHPQEQQEQLEAEEPQHKCPQHQNVGSSQQQQQQQQQQQAGVPKVAGTIVAVLYDEQIRELKKTPGAWPPEFGDGLKGPSAQAWQGTITGNGSGDEGSQNSDSEDGLPPLEKNTNRRIIVHDDSDSDDEEDSDE